MWIVEEVYPMRYDCDVSQLDSIYILNLLPTLSLMDRVNKHTLWTEARPCNCTRGKEPKRYIMRWRCLHAFRCSMRERKSDIDNTYSLDHSWYLAWYDMNMSQVGKDRKQDMCNGCIETKPGCHHSSSDTVKMKQLGCPARIHRSTHCRRCIE